MNEYLTLIKILTLIGVIGSVAGALEKCRPIKLPNGRARIQRQGRLVRFRCLKGYELVGRRYMNCFRGQWDFERDSSLNPPMCVKPGCRASSYVNGHFLETYKGAVVSVVCNLGYTLIGSSTVYCNGYEWNQPFPECKAINPTPPKSCDFEDGLCGWTQEPYGDWRWHTARESHQESIRHRVCNDTEDRRRPPFDCGNLGRYILLGDSSSRFANATERLFSPVFPPEYSNNSCFAFWYTMNGLTAGYLKVFVKPEGVELYNTIPPFWVNGHQSYSWIPGYFPLYSSPAPFQVVIEGRSLPGNESEIAFDAVQILSAKECASFKDIYLAYLPYTSTTAESSDGDDSVSCANRCGSTPSNSRDKCECLDTCLKEGTCCSDYEIFCSTEGTTSPSTTEDITESLTSARTSAETTGRTNNAIEESNDVSRHTENPILNNRSNSPFNNWQVTSVTYNDFSLQSEKASARKSATYARSFGTTTPRRLPTTERTSKRTRGPPRRRPDHINFPLKEDPSHSNHVTKIRVDGRISEDRVHGAGEDSPLSITSDGDESRPTSSGIPPGTIEAAIGVTGVVVCGLLIAAFIRRRRRKKTEKESMVEDSDSICFGMNPIYEKFSSQSSLICIRPNVFVDGDVPGGGNRRSSDK